MSTLFRAWLYTKLYQNIVDTPLSGLRDLNCLRFCQVYQLTYLSLILATASISGEDQDTLFMQAYQRIVSKYAIQYDEVDRKRVTEEGRERTLRDFFGNYELVVFDNVSQFDFEGVKGRMLSSSYSPLAGHPNHDPMIAELNRYAENGRIPFNYDGRVIYGRL